MPRLIILTLLAVCTMSAAPVLIKSTSANEITIALARLLIATLCISPFVLYRKRLASLSRQQWLWMLLIGAVFAAHWLTYFVSIKLSTASIGALAISTFGVQYLFLAQLLNGERTSPVEWFAVVVCLAGCIIVVPEFNLRHEHAAGMLAGVVSGTLYAALPLLHQRAAAIDNTTRTWGQFAFALLCVLPLLPTSDWSLKASDYYQLALLGVVCTVIAHGLWVKVTTELPAIYPAVIYYLYVPLAMLSSAYFLNETMSGRKLLGAALILGASCGATVYRLARRN